MVEVTEADRVAIIEICQHIVPCDKAWWTEILSGKHDHWPPLQILATHREAAAKAERDRLLNWAANNFLAEGNYTGALVVHKLARALEQNP